MPIPDTQFSFGGEEDDGGDEVVFSDFHGNGGGEKVEGFPFASSSFWWRIKLSILNSSLSISSFIIFLHNASMISFVNRGGTDSSSSSEVQL